AAVACTATTGIGVVGPVPTDGSGTGATGRVCTAGTAGRAVCAGIERTENIDAAGGDDHERVFADHADGRAVPDGERTEVEHRGHRAAAGLRTQLERAAWWERRARQGGGVEHGAVAEQERPTPCLSVGRCEVKRLMRERQVVDHGAVLIVVTRTAID